MPLEIRLTERPNGTVWWSVSKSNPRIPNLEDRLVGGWAETFPAAFEQANAARIAELDRLTEEA
jgi:hypothetical protein